jgi:anaerobic ribonucleoside-triphosphate reductase activating protein
MTDVLRVATIVDDTEAEGPGRRFAIWVAGCSIRCAGCCNPEMFDPRGGEAIGVGELAARVAALVDAGVEGVTLLGGEPFEQAAGAAQLCEAVRAGGGSVMVFTGYELAELRARDDAAVARLLAACDLLVDGPYVRERPEPPPPAGRRWIGSANQTMHFLTSRYADDDPRLRAANTIEIRVSARGGVVINGWPSADQLVPMRPRRRG